MKRLLICYGAGALGALLTCFLGWFFANYGVFKDFGVQVDPQLSIDWLYPAIVWGSIWGMVFALVKTHSKPVLFAVIIALTITALQLFLLYPHTSVHGIHAKALDNPTAMVHVIFNLIWASITVGIIHSSR